MELQSDVSRRIGNATTSAAQLTTLPSPSTSDTAPRPIESNLERYIAVGTLKYYDGDEGQDFGYPKTQVSSLESRSWIQTSVLRNEACPGWAFVRIYVLPDDLDRGLVDRSSPSLRRDLKVVMSKLDTSIEAWEGKLCRISKATQEQRSEDESESLFYIFNTLESPDPNPDALSDPWANLAMEQLLWNDTNSSGPNRSAGLNQQEGVAGLKTTLYPYQRRSAAFMVQKESEPGESLDPRLQCFRGPTEQPYYYDKEEGSIVREKRLYSNACGGILAETMGFGKTLICLALILATRGHFPRIPSNHLEGQHPVRQETASLAKMVAATIGRFSIPWKPYFDPLRPGDDSSDHSGSSDGPHFERYLAMCERNRGEYTISRAPRYNRGTKNSNVKVTRIRLCSGTLVVVPPNLVDHWLQEISKHTDGLKVFVLRDSRTPTPPADDLLQYDIILFAKPRFDQESPMFAGDPRWTTYESPLRELHWLRIIVDEGHNFASTGQKSKGIHLLEALHVERRWVVSGTPSSGLYGVEVSLASQETTPGASMDEASTEEPALDEADEETTSINVPQLPTPGPLGKISHRDSDGEGFSSVPYFGGIAVQQRFSGTQDAPASNGTQTADEEKAATILQTRRQANKVLNEELKNLDKMKRMVEFLSLKPWTNSRIDKANWGKYMKPVGKDGKRRMSPSLRSTLQSIIVRHRAEHINRELTLPNLHNRVVSLEPTYHDKLSLNLFIFQLAVNAITSERTDEDYMFHAKNRKHLSQLINNLRHAGFWWTGHKLDEVENTLHVAQTYLEKNEHRMCGSDIELLRKAIETGERAIGCHSWNAFSKFDELGVFVQDFPDHARGTWGIDGSQDYQELLLLSISQARLAQQFVTSRLCTVDPGEGLAGEGIRAKSRLHKVDDIRQVVESGSIDTKQKQLPALKSSPKKPKPNPQQSLKFKSLPPESPLAETKVVATTSAKMTYLLEKVLEFQESEKIIIFYEHSSTAFLISEGLSMLGIEFRIYANGLKAELKSQWLKLFNERNSNGSNSVRVLLMDLRQASHGLHVACASRVFIVDPIWDPNIESQAIKRAHRISQTRPVFVETLVLKDTLEDKMLRRRKGMTSAELQHAEKDLLDDQTMSYTIQTEGFLPISSASPAYLKEPPGLFDCHKLPVPELSPCSLSPCSSPPPSQSSSPHLFRLTDPSTSSAPYTQVAPPSPSPSPQKSVMKRPPAEDIPYLFSDVIGSPSDTPRKKRRLSAKNNIVTANGIVMIAPKSRTPRSRRSSSTQTSRPTSREDEQAALGGQEIVAAPSESGAALSAILPKN